MKYLLTSLLLSANLYSVGQCKYLENKVDEFTGKGRIITKNKMVGSADGFTGFQLANVDNTKFAIFTLYTTRIKSNNEECKVLIRFTDGEILEIQNTSDQTSYSTGGGWALPYYLSLTDELKEILANKSIELLRFEVSSGASFDKRMNEKGAKRINKSMSCI